MAHGHAGSGPRSSSSAAASTIAIEPPVILSQASRDALQRARRQLWEGDVESSEPRDDLGDVVERAWLDKEAPAGDRRPLFAKMEKLLAERGGDFSKLHSSQFKRSSTAQQRDDNDDDDEHELDLGVAKLGEEGQEKTGDEKQAGGEDAQEEEASGRDAMTIEEMRQLRSEMLDNLNTARGSLYYSHSLVSLLLNSSKVESGSSGPGGRAGTPSSSAGGVARAGTATSMTGGAQRNAPASQLQLMSNAANLEADLGIEPNVFGASKLQLKKAETEDGEEDDEANEEDEDDDDGNEDLQKELEKQQKQDARIDEADLEDRARDLIECYQAKHDGLASAADILAKGAKALRASSSSEDETKRWAALTEARSGGWGLVPGRPIRVKNGKRELLPDDAIRRRDEAARDAWIGYAAPEAATAYQKRALAYYGYSGDGIVFAARPNRTFQVRLIVKDAHGAKPSVWTSKSKAPGSADGGEQTEEGIEARLRSAQRELADVELYDALLAECRALSSSSLARTTIEDAYSVSLEINPLTDMCFSMVENEDTDTDKVRSADSEQDEAYSPIANVVLSSLRLGLGKKYRQRAGIVKPAKRKAQGKTDDVFRRTAPLLAPVLGLIHYSSFVSKLKTTLDDIISGRGATYKFHTMSGSTYASKVLRSAFEEEEEDEDGGTELEQDALEKVIGAHATIYSASSDKKTAPSRSPVALLTIAYPSRLSLSLPARGVHLPSIDLLSLRDILLDQLSKP